MDGDSPENGAQFGVTPVARDGCHVLVLEGELDRLEAPELEAAIDACADGLPVVVDLSSLTFIDSAGLHVLLRARDAGRPAALVRAPGSNIDRVLEIVKVESSLSIYDDLAAAVAGIARS